MVYDYIIGEKVKKQNGFFCVCVDQEVHDTALERLREEELSRVAMVIQRVMLGHKDRCSFCRKKSRVE